MSNLLRDRISYWQSIFFEFLKDSISHQSPIEHDRNVWISNVDRIRRISRNAWKIALNFLPIGRWTSTNLDTWNSKFADFETWNGEESASRRTTSQRSSLSSRCVDLHIKRYCFSYGTGRVSGFAFYAGVRVRREAATVPDIRPILRTFATYRFRNVACRLSRGFNATTHGEPLDSCDPCSEPLCRNPFPSRNKSSPPNLEGSERNSFIRARLVPASPGSIIARSTRATDCKKRRRR